MNMNTAATASNVLSFSDACYARHLREAKADLHALANDFPPSSATYQFFHAYARGEADAIEKLGGAFLEEVPEWGELHYV